MTFRECCDAVVKDCRTRQGLNFANAVAYANAGRHMVDPVMIETQCLYILGNLQYWRGPLAKEVKSWLKRIIINKGRDLDA